MQAITLLLWMESLTLLAFTMLCDNGPAWMSKAKERITLFNSNLMVKKGRGENSGIIRQSAISHTIAISPKFESHQSHLQRPYSWSPEFGWQIFFEIKRSSEYLFFCFTSDQSKKGNPNNHHFPLLSLKS